MAGDNSQLVKITPEIPGQTANKRRVVVYVDGFNLYFGLKEKNWKRHYWLNLQELSSRLLEADQELICVKYFTARVTSPPPKAMSEDTFLKAPVPRATKADRQNVFLEALSTLPKVRIYYGRYYSNLETCQNCGAETVVPKEKMSDVNLAVEMLVDAYEDRFDTAILISGDSDLVGPLKAVRRLFPAKRIIVAFPPERHSFDLENEAHASFQIWQSVLKKSQFLEEVVKPDGHVLKRPAEWR